MYIAELMENDLEVEFDDGTVDPYKLTFVLKGIVNCNVPDTKNRYKNLHKQVG